MSQALRGRYSAAEERANGITHGLGALLAVAGMAFLVVAAVQRGTAVHIVSSIVFGLSLLNLYTSSTLYHTIGNPATKRTLRWLDHAAIFLLIAGTYTPFTLVTLRGPWGWSIFGVVWGLAVIGLFFEGALRRRWVGFSLGLYILMGWVAVAAIKPAHRVAAPRRDRAARRRRPGLHLRDDLLHLPPHSVPPCLVAPRRTRRQRPALVRGAALRPPTGLNPRSGVYMPMHCVYCSF